MHIYTCIYKFQPLSSQLINFWRPSRMFPNKHWSIIPVTRVAK